MLQLKEILWQGLKFQKIALEHAVVADLLRFVDLLDQWNQVYNLTAVRDKPKMISRHLLDSLTALDFIDGFDHIADLGSGAGLPGIPLAICRPDKHFTLIDSNLKKTRFLTHVITRLKLQNVEVVRNRIESLQSTQNFECLITRAYAAPRQVMVSASHLLMQDGILILMMAKQQQLRLTDKDTFQLQSSTPVEVYNELSTRHIVVFAKNNGLRA